MKIAFDHQIFALQRFGGISRYLVRLAEGLQGLGQDPRVFAPLHCNHYVADLPPGLLQGRETARLPDKALRLLAPLIRAQAGRAIRGFAPEILHETYYDPSALRAPGAARVVTVHDMIHERFATGVARRVQAHKRAAVTRADHILCVSECTKQDLCELLSVPPERVSVVYHGFERFPVAPMPTDLGDTPYLLFVGHRGGYKNFEGLVRAVGQTPHLREALDIVAFGGGAFSAAEQGLVEQAGLRPAQVRQIGGGDGVLGALYAGAEAFVYPSRYEGFGMPLLEAMALDCPVVSSSASAMPEVAGPAAEYFDPEHGPEALADAITRAIMPARRAALVTLGRARLPEFSWQRCAEESLSAYQRALGH